MIIRLLSIGSLALSIFLAVVDSAWAWPPKFAPEFELTNSNLLAIRGATGSFMRREEEEVARGFSRYLSRLCPDFDCTFHDVSGKWGNERVFSFALFPDRPFEIRISWDPKVVEVLMTPLTVSEMNFVKYLVETFIFQSAREYGLFPSKTKTSGHLNMDVDSALNWDPELFLRFYVDHANHPEWDLGILGLDPNNAPPLSLLGKKQRDELSKIVAEFKSGSYTSLHQVAMQIQTRVHSRTLTWNSSTGKSHYQSVGLKTLTGVKHWLFGQIKKPAPRRQQRVELRGIYGQESYEQFIRLSEFVEARLVLLRKEMAEGRPIVYLAPDRQSYTNDALLRLFVNELRHMDLKFEDYSILMEDTIIKRANPFLLERICKDALKP